MKCSPSTFCAGLAFALVAGLAAAAGQAPEVAPLPEPEAAAAEPIAIALAPDGDAGPGDPARGEAKAAVCAACHGPDGNSTNPEWPKLAGQHERYIARQLALYKSGARENAVMLGFAATLSAQDMRDLGAYFARQKVTPGVADESLVARGERLWRGGDLERGIPACMACHGPTGRGNPFSGYPALAGQHADYTAAMLRAFRSGLVLGKGSDANPVMAEVARHLSDEEIEALASYIEGLHAAWP
ncbi:MAG: c-type cytochrome [Xanthomonadales bacterium]|nr:c-type cytochrome [Xanthomonadales bacterium]